jgi:hypothetical protein
MTWPAGSWVSPTRWNALRDKDGATVKSFPHLGRASVCILKIEPSMVWTSIECLNRFEPFFTQSPISRFEPGFEPSLRLATFWFELEPHCSCANSENPFCYFIGDLYGLNCNARLNLEFFPLWWVPTPLPLWLQGWFSLLFKHQQRVRIFVWVCFA